MNKYLFFDKKFSILIEIYYMPFYQKINEQFFKIIDTEEKAYFLGLLYADGSLNNKLSTLAISLIEDDQEVLEILSKLIYKKRPLRTIKYKNIKHKTQKQLVITGKNEKEYFHKYGLIQNKSKIYKEFKFDLIPDNLFCHFVRGYFDGDGCAYYNKKTKCQHITITGHTEFVKTLKKHLKIYIPELGTLPIYRRRKHIEYNSTIQIGGNRQTKLLYDFMYCRASVFIKRKKQNFVAFSSDTN